MRKACQNRNEEVEMGKQKCTDMRRSTKKCEMRDQIFLLRSETGNRLA